MAVDANDGLTSRALPLLGAPFRTHRAASRRAMAGGKQKQAAKAKKGKAKAKGKEKTGGKQRPNDTVSYTHLTLPTKA